MKIDEIGIVEMSTISPLGFEEDEILKNYQQAKSKIEKHNFSDKTYWSSKINAENEQRLKLFIEQDKNFERSDRSTQLALFASSQLNANQINNSSFGVNIGSSRGATSIWEKNHSKFLNQERISPITSPTTSLGNISSWVGQYLSADFAFSHSMTCSTAALAIVNGIAWLQSGLCETMICGGSEAPLTPYTLKQMESLRIYSQRKNKDFPCLAGKVDKNENTMVLGEGAVLFVLKKNTKNKLANIHSIGLASEPISTATSISKTGLAFKESMTAALKNFGEKPDVIVTHTPGTILGDKAEYQAIDDIFKSEKPAISNNKWLIGHSLGASAGLSLHMAILMLKHQVFFENPLFPQKSPEQIKSVLVNASGFGGNSVSILLTKV